MKSANPIMRLEFSDSTSADVFKTDYAYVQVSEFLRQEPSDEYLVHQWVNETAEYMAANDQHSKSGITFKEAGIDKETVIFIYDYDVTKYGPISFLKRYMPKLKQNFLQTFKNAYTRDGGQRKYYKGLINTGRKIVHTFQANIPFNGESSCDMVVSSDEIVSVLESRKKK